MNGTKLAVGNWGIYTDQFADAASLIAAVKAQAGIPPGLNCADADRAQMTDPDLETALQGLDNINQYAFRALHDALAGRNSAMLHRAGLLLLSAWGPMDHTASFLDSMLEAQGRYASPRHFTRSVYSTVASHAAIYFGIHGPCETVTHGQWPICSVLDRAADMLASQRVDHVIACWADQSSKIAEDLCRRGATALNRHEFARFTSDEAGYGSVALVLKRPEESRSSDVLLEILDTNTASASAPVTLNIHNFPTDGAVHLAAALAAVRIGAGELPIYFTETDPRGRSRFVRVRGSIAP